jgi:crossover junction endodeoxyribonuclease RuvC
MQVIIGIDPGKSGGIAWRIAEWGEPQASKMPDVVHDLASLLRSLVTNYGQCKCYLEKVQAMPKQGVTSCFTFGKGLGNIEGVLAALEIPFEWVTPQKWQKALSCMSAGEKNVTKCKAYELFPKTKWTHATADAALICEYGRRQEGSSNASRD